MLGLIFVTIGVTVAWFTYARLRLKEHTITSGTIKFHYKEEARKNVDIQDIVIGENVVASDTTTFTETEYIDPGQESMTKTLEINTENPDTTVTIENLTPSTSFIPESNIKRLTNNYTITLIPGTNTFRITITSLNKKIHKEYTLIVNVEYPIFDVSLVGNHVTFGSESIDAAYNDSNTVTVQPSTGYYISGESCTNGYTVALTTGTSATSSQTITITNNSETGDGTCTIETSPIEYTITYTLSGGTATNPTKYTIETETITLANPTRADYNFIGWTGSNGATKQTTVKINKGSTSNKSYTANYKDNGGIYDENDNQIATWSDLVALGLNISTDYASSNDVIYSSTSCSYIIRTNYAKNCKE